MSILASWKAAIKDKQLELLGRTSEVAQAPPQYSTDDLSLICEALRGEMQDWSKSGPVERIMTEREDTVLRTRIIYQRISDCTLHFWMQTIFVLE